jgi:hypothetical protein
VRERLRLREQRHARRQRKQNQSPSCAAAPSPWARMARHPPCRLGATAATAKQRADVQRAWSGRADK